MFSMKIELAAQPETKESLNLTFCQEQSPLELVAAGTQDEESKLFDSFGGMQGEEGGNSLRDLMSEPKDQAAFSFSE